MKLRLAILFLGFYCLSTYALKIALEPVITDGIADPTYVTTAPGDGDTLYIVQQRGSILRAQNGKVLPKKFLDIESKVSAGGEMGLLSVAFHPNYLKNGRYFVDYDIRAEEGGNPKSDIWTVVAEFNRYSPGEKVLLRISQPYTNHKGGQLLFDKKGYLYIGTGDGGYRADPHGNGQNKQSWLGKILRLDVDHEDKQRKTLYSIPPDNPFKAGGGRPEIYAWGMRNPWRFSIDKVTEALITGDVGQDLWEEIDIIERGKNYGWNVMEGTHCFQPSKGCDQTGLAKPIFEYDHSQGNNCIIGGHVYRGKKIPDLQGVYLYADYGSGRIWGLTYDFRQKKVVKNEELLSSGMPISSFGEDAAGEILVASYDGRIFRVAKAIK